MTAHLKARLRLAKTNGKLKREIKRLKKIEHAAWHLLDDSEHRVREEIIVVDQKQFDELSKLLPEEHP